MRIIVLLLFMNTFLLLTAQNNYYFGYSDGFKYGCQCNDLSPKNVTLIKGSYDLGYLDGKVDGLIYATNKKQNNTTYTRQPSNYNVELYKPNYQYLYEGLAAKQNAYNSNRQIVDQTLESITSTIQKIRDNSSHYYVNKNLSRLYLIENAYAKDLKNLIEANIDYGITSNAQRVLDILNKHSTKIRQLITTISEETAQGKFRLQQLKNLYNSFENKAIVIKDGWYMVYATDDQEFCDIRRVYVSNNRVTKYVIEGGTYKYLEGDDISFSSPINNCKSTIKTILNNAFISIYFINNLSDKNYSISAPPAVGSASFWTNYTSENIDVFVEGQYVGTIDSYFSVSPNCGQRGTVVYKNKPGTYSFEAVSKTSRWQGTLTISGTSCVMKILNL